MQIEHWDPARDGELTEANMRRKLQARGYSVSRYVYSPGTRFPEHDHGVDKIDGVLFRNTSSTVRKWWGTNPWSAWTRYGPLDRASASDAP